MSNTSEKDLDIAIVPFYSLALERKGTFNHHREHTTMNTDDLTYYNPLTKTVGYWIENGGGGDFYTTSGEYSGFYDSGEQVYALFDAEGVELAFGDAPRFDEAREYLSESLRLFEESGVLPEDDSMVFTDGRGGYVAREYVEGELRAYAYLEDLAEARDMVLVGSTEATGATYLEESMRSIEALRSSKPHWEKEMKGLYVASFAGQVLTVEKIEGQVQFWRGTASQYFPEIDDEIIQYTSLWDSKHEAMQGITQYILS